MKWRAVFLWVGLILIVANVGHLTVRLLFGLEVPDDLLTVSGQLISWPPLVGLVSIGGGARVMEESRAWREKKG